MNFFFSFTRNNRLFVQAKKLLHLPEKLTVPLSKNIFKTFPEKANFPSKKNYYKYQKKQFSKQRNFSIYLKIYSFYT